MAWNGTQNGAPLGRSVYFFGDSAEGGGWRTFTEALPATPEQLLLEESENRERFGLIAVADAQHAEHYGWKGHTATTFEAKAVRVGQHAAAGSRFGPRSDDASAPHVGQVPDIGIRRAPPVPLAEEVQRKHADDKEPPANAPAETLRAAVNSTAAQSATMRAARTSPNAGAIKHPLQLPTANAEAAGHAAAAGSSAMLLLPLLICPIPRRRLDLALRIASSLMTTTCTCRLLMTTDLLQSCFSSPMTPPRLEALPSMLLQLSVLAKAVLMSRSCALQFPVPPATLPPLRAVRCVLVP